MRALNDDIQPTSCELIIRANEEGSAMMELARWGFVPFFHKAEKFAPNTFNARAEGIEKALCGGILLRLNDA
nr:SOS response-associated peptidase family protein [Granulicella tundricola]